MQVAFSSFAEFRKLTPDADTVVISLTGREPQVTEITGTKWGKLLSTKFEVLSPEGPQGSFKPMDEQAKKFANEIYPFIKDAKKIIVQCQYGEIRSRAVATGIAFSELGQCDVHCITGGAWIGDSCGRHDTFGARTYGWITRTIDKLNETVTE